jgi:Asp/Glu/hydantoin racemase
MICYKTGSRRLSTYTTSKDSFLILEEILDQYFKSQDRGGKK